MPDLTAPVLVAGYFPPPPFGQSVATERLASLLDGAIPLTRVPLREGLRGGLREGLAARSQQMLDFLHTSRTWRQTLRAAPGATVLWTTPSPRPASHLRDVALVLPALRRDQRVFGVIHWGNFQRLGAHALLRPTVQALVRRLDGFVFLSEGLAAQCAGFIPAHKRLVIPNTVDDRMIASGEEIAARRAPSPETPLRILFLGTMMPEKGVFDVLAAVERLRAQGVAVTATFAGSWPNNPTRLRFEAEAAPLGEAAQYVGTVRDRDALRQLLLAHHVLALPSTYAAEAQPLVLLEALATATPVVTTRVGAIPELIQDGRDGVLVPVRDLEALEAAFRHCAEGPAWQHLSTAGRAHFDAHFAPAVVRQAWLSLVARGSLPRA